MGRIIAVTSGKGGTGKSTVATGLALTFANRGQRVLLIDLDAGLRCLDLMLGIDNRVIFDLSDILSGRPLDDAVYPAEHNENVMLIPAPAKCENFSGEKLGILLADLIRSFDTVILDFPAGIDFRLYRTLPRLTQIVTVCNPDPVSVRDAAVVCKQLPDFQKKPLLILNKFSAEKIRNGIYKNIDSIIDTSGFRLLGIVPLDEALALLPVRHNLPQKCRGYKALQRIAQRLNDQPVPLPKPKKI